MFTTDKIIDFINRENKEVLPKIYFDYYVKFDIDDNKKIVIVNEGYIEEVYGIHKRFIKEDNTYILEERLINFNDVEEVIPNLKGIIEEELIENLVNIADYILIGGGMAYTFLSAAGFNIGSSLLDSENIEFCKSMLGKYPDKIILPTDKAIPMYICVAMSAFVSLPSSLLNLA